MKKFSIRSKFVFLILTILIPFIVLYMVRILSFHSENIENELESNRQLAEAISSSFMNYIEEIWTQETTLNLIFIENTELPQEKIQNYLEETKKSQGIADVYTWVNPEGYVVASTRKDLIKQSVADRDYYSRVINGEDKIISDKIIGRSSKQPVIPIVKAARKDGRLIGFMIAIINVDNLSQRLPSSSIIKEKRFGFVSNSGERVYQSDISNNSDEHIQMSKDSPAWLALKGEVFKTAGRISGYDGTKRIGVYIPIREIGWACFITSSYQSVIGKYEQQLRNDIIIMVVVALVSILLAMYMGKHILRRIYRLKEAANMIVDGDYSARANITGYDEIAVTAQAFDHMAEGIENYDRLKTQFFINLSHELKTPINVIFASIQLITQINTETDLNECVTRIHRHTKMVKQNCYRLIRLVNNLIDITRYDSGFLNLKPNIYNIVQIVEEITISIVKYAEIKDIEVIFDTDIEEKYIVCDPDIIERIMLNLFSNSLKFTNEKGRIMVNIYDKEEGVEITVKDTGIGIPKDKLNMIFERFRQVDDSLNRNNEGSGIGLSLVKALVESHKGNVSVKSVIGKGTEFVIQLPVGILTDKERFYNNVNNRSKGMIDRINIEFSDIYSISDIGKNQRDAVEE